VTGSSALDTFRLDGKVAVVTGSTRGIGRSALLALCDAGADAVITGRDEDAANEVLAAVRARGRRGHVILGDLLLADMPERIVDETVEQLGSLDILVNNAGICEWGESLQSPMDTLRNVLAVNVESLWAMSMAAAVPMIENGAGVIINVGSISGLIVNRPQWQASYNASKAAVHQLTKSLALEWAPNGIRVNAIAPGYVKTGIAPIDDPQYAPWWVDLCPQQRYALPEELGPTFVYLASDASSFMTGEVVVVDGGYTIT
jgi:NAD(P)-dependent dehydrogenase (short-subunit alcohol dehydrogenase family)